METKSVGIEEVKMALKLGVGSPMFSGIAGPSKVSAEISSETGQFVGVDDKQAAERFAIFSSHLKKVESAKGKLDAIVREFGSDHNMYSVFCGKQCIMFRGPPLETVKASLLAQAEREAFEAINSGVLLVKLSKPRGAL